jgi:tripartite-type tricarboxylate transporter receptor subunit TctC
LPPRPVCLCPRTRPKRGAFGANVLVVNAAAIPARSAQKLVSLLKARPGQLNFGAGGAGTTSSLAAVMLQSLAKVDFLIVQYKGAGPALTDLLGGHVQIGNYAMPIVLPHIKSGRLRALRVATPRCSVLMPEMPTIAKSGVPGFEVRTWYAVLSSRGTPAAIVKALNAKLRKIIEDDEIQKLTAAQGLESFLAPPEEFEKFIKSEISTWTKLGADFKLSVDTD